MGNHTRRKIQNVDLLIKNRTIDWNDEVLDEVHYNEAAINFWNFVLNSGG
jgi:hypothetical protein